MPRYIDADALRDALYYADAITMKGVRILNQFPTISPDDVRDVGEWLPDVGEFGFPEIPCSVCGYKSGHYGFNYCPSCGARMKGAEDGTTDN